MINNTCLSSVCYNLFRASKKLCQASKNHQRLARHGKLVLKIMSVSDISLFDDLYSKLSDHLCTLDENGLIRQ